MEDSLKLKPHVHFEVEKVIGISKDGTYQVQWAPMWVSSFHLRGCEHLIQDFLKQQSEEEEMKLTITSSVFNDSPLQQSETSDQQQPQQQEQQNQQDLPHFNQTSQNCIALQLNRPQHTNKDFDIVQSESPEINLNEKNQGRDGDEQLECEEENNMQFGYVDNNIKMEEGDEQYVSVNPHDEQEINSKEMLNNGTYNKLDTSALGGDGTYMPGIPKQNILLNTAIDYPQNYGKSGISISSSSSVKPRPQDNSTKNKKQFICQQCGKSCSRKDALERHMYTHSGVKPYACTVCGKKFSRNDDLNVHHRIHTGYKPFSCSGCGKSFITSSDRNKHFRRCSGNMVDGESDPLNYPSMA